MQDVHYCLQGKLINLGFITRDFFLKKPLAEYFITCVWFFHIIANSLK